MIPTLAAFAGKYMERDRLAKEWLMQSCIKYRQQRLLAGIGYYYELSIVTALQRFNQAKIGESQQRTIRLAGRIAKQGQVGGPQQRMGATRKDRRSLQHTQAAQLGDQVGEQISG